MKFGPQPFELGQDVGKQNKGNSNEVIPNDAKAGVVKHQGPGLLGRPKGDVGFFVIFVHIW